MDCWVMIYVTDARQTRHSLVGEKRHYSVSMEELRFLG